MGSPCVRACVLRFRGALIGGRAHSGFLSGAGVRCCLRRLRRVRPCERALFARVYFWRLSGRLTFGGSRCLFPLCVFVCTMLCLLRLLFILLPRRLLRLRSAFLLMVSLPVMGFCHSHRLYFFSLCFFILLFLFWCHSTFSDADDMSVFCRVITTSALSRTARAPRRRPRLRRTTGTRTTSTMLRALMLSPAMIAMVRPRFFH